MKTLKRLTGILIFCLAIASINAAAQTSAFTYQGKLTDMSAAANGNYDFTFRLFDAATEGAQIGTDVVRDDVPVSGGIFTVNLDFGADAFANGAARFLEISVRPGASTGAFTTLAPRQQITSAPFSIKTLNAASADALSAACVLCVTDAQIQTIDGSKVTGTVANATTAGNVSGIVPIANGGTGSSMKNFVDLNTNQSIFGNKTFSNATTFNGAVTVAGSNNTLTVDGSLNVGFNITADQFHGNGDGLVNVPGTFKWQNVSGLAQQAQTNTGYVANNDAQVTITLPTSIGIGETVRVSGVGAGGWKIAQNDGQSIIGVHNGLQGKYWTPHESNRNWFAIASSADGSKLIAAVQNGQLYTSTDSGNTWTPRENNRYWNAVASSADGSKLVAVGNGQIYTSTDSGVTWTPRESSRLWRGVASSADGTKLVAVVEGGQIYTSTDSGVTWTPRATNRDWQAVASSADGTKLVAAVLFGVIYTSTDSGITWFPRATPDGQLWQAVASSADGTKLIAAAQAGQVYISTDSGLAWLPRLTNQNWFSVASSADGSKMVAVGLNTQIFTSDDSGFNWTSRDYVRNWQAVTSSANGIKLAATVGFGRIYTSTSATTVGKAGYLTGEQFSSIELLYMGNGQFLPVSHSGAFSGF